MADERGISALGGIQSGAQNLDSLIADEIAKMPQGWQARPLRDNADIDRIKQMMVERGFTPDEIDVALARYIGEGGKNYDESSPQEYEYLELDDGR